MISHAIEQLGAFFKNGEVASEIRIAAEALGTERLRVVIIHLFKWLNSQARMGSKRPLSLIEGAEWSQNVCDLLSAVKNLDAIFAVTRNELDFRDQIQEDARDEIRRFVHEVYRPRLFSDPKRPNP
jgi:hypothetical protein